MLENDLQRATAIVLSFVSLGSLALSHVILQYVAEMIKNVKYADGFKVRLAYTASATAACWSLGVLAAWLADRLALGGGLLILFSLTSIVGSIGATIETHPGLIKTKASAIASAQEES